MATLYSEFNDLHRSVIKQHNYMITTGWLLQLYNNTFVEYIAKYRMQYGKRISLCN